MTAFKLNALLGLAYPSSLLLTDLLLLQHSSSLLNDGVRVQLSKGTGVSQRIQFHRLPLLGFLAAIFKKNTLIRILNCSIVYSVINARRVSEIIQIIEIITQC